MTMQITLANLKDATEQQVFDQVASHLIKQKVRATNDAGMCQYRPGNGLMCAAGCLMTDEEYDIKFDKRGSWLSCSEAFPEQVPSKHAYFIDMLQKMHDMNVDRWDIDEAGAIDYPRRLKHFAKKHKLQFNLEELSK
jgi:hypothetical protein